MTYVTSQKHCDVHGFRCTYEVVTVGSAIAGEASELGYLDWQGNAVNEARDSHWDLQDLSRLSVYRLEGSGGRVPDWVTCEALMDDLIKPQGVWSFLETAQQYSEDDEVWGGCITIHRPDWCTDASWLRTLKLLGWKYRY
ncbi:MAG: hypothetical protein EBV86_12730 [Marivivens sp.]|nr:hypothetical protein [Marivivens sp.]